MQIKLVNCGDSIIVYDYMGKRMIDKSVVEEDPFKGDTCKLREIILTNFTNEGIFSTFTIKIALKDYNQIQEKLNSFIIKIKELSGYSYIKYLAVAALPTTNNEDYIGISIVTNIENIYSQDDEILMCGGHASVEIYTFEEVLEMFTSVYSQSLSSSFLKQYPVIMFQNKLKKPKVLRNGKATTFIEEQNLLDYPYQNSYEFYDDQTGLTIVNEYSLYNNLSYEGICDGYYI